MCVYTCGVFVHVCVCVLSFDVYICVLCMHVVAYQSANECRRWQKQHACSQPCACVMVTCVFCLARACSAASCMTMEWLVASYARQSFMRKREREEGGEIIQNKGNKTTPVLVNTYECRSFSLSCFLAFNISLLFLVIRLRHDEFISRPFFSLCLSLCLSLMKECLVQEGNEALHHHEPQPPYISLTTHTTYTHTHTHTNSLSLSLTLSHTHPRSLPRHTHTNTYCTRSEQEGRMTDSQRGSRQEHRAFWPPCWLAACVVC